MASSALPETYKRIVPANKETKTADHIKEEPLPKPGKNQVLVRVEFAPINPSDIATLMGGYKNPNNAQKAPADLMGGEGSGVIVAVGEDLKVPHQVGEKVHIVGMGTWGQYHVTASESCSKVQEGLSLEQAACHLVNPGTVHYMATLIAQGGHKAAIHTAGSSALGKMLIRYLKSKGVKLINIVRRDEYIEELTKEEGADYVLNSQSPDFEAKLKEIAEREQATIAFDAIAGDMPNIVLKNMPPGSICYVYGGLSGRNVTVELGELFFKKTITGLYLTHHIMDVAKSGKIAEFYHEIHTHLPTTFRSNIQKVFPLEQYKEALAYYKDNSSKGKILLKTN